MTPHERLTRLAEILEARPADDPGFDIHVYSCGSTACALGWGARDPVLNAEGLILCGITGRRPFPLDWLGGASVGIRNEHPGDDVSYQVAMEKFFGLKREGPKREGDEHGHYGHTQEYFWLFHSPSYPPHPGPHDVARRIRTILAEQSQCQSS